MEIFFMEKQLTIIVKRCNEKGLISFKVFDQKIEKMIKTMLKKTDVFNISKQIDSVLLIMNRMNL